MGIESSQVVDIQTRRSGNIRARFEYQLTDGRVIRIGPMSFPDAASATVALASRESSVLQQAQGKDAEEAVGSVITTAHKEASVEDVYRAWVREGMRESDSRRAYRILKAIATKVIALGLTVPQLAARLKLEEDEIQRLLDRWQYLNANKLVIDAYKAVVEGDI